MKNFVLGMVAGGFLATIYFRYELNNVQKVFDDGLDELRGKLRTWTPPAEKPQQTWTVVNRDHYYN